MQQTISESKKFFFKLLLTWNQTRLNKEKRQERKETKDGFPVKDRKKVKRKRSEENRIIPDQ